MQSLREFLIQRKQQGTVIYPPANQWFAALNTTPFEKVRVVILGQDPYHGLDQAHGLCFSVTPGIKVPPSLANIYKEIKSDLRYRPAQSRLFNKLGSAGRNVAQMLLLPLKTAVQALIKVRVENSLPIK